MARRKPRDATVDLARVLARARPEFQARFFAVIAAIQDRYTLAQLADLIQRGRAEEVLRFVDRAAAQLGLTWAGTYQGGGFAATAAANRAAGAVHLAFDQTNIRAVEAIRSNQLRLVREFSREQRAATRQALIRGVREGSNPVEQARAFRQSIGLTAYQEQAVENYRRALEAGSSDALQRELRDRRFDRTVSAAVDGDATLSGGQIDAMVERYRERYIKYRAEVIARTEANTAANEGAREAFLQAVESGDVSADRIERTWSTAEDARVRDSHRAMDGQVVEGIDEPFTTGDGVKLRYPGDPNAPPEERIQCRCAVQTRILAALDQGPVRVSVFEGS